MMIVVNLKIIADLCDTCNGNFLIWFVPERKGIEPNISDSSTFFLDILILPFNDGVVKLFQLHSDGTGIIRRTNLPVGEWMDWANSVSIIKSITDGIVKLAGSAENLLPRVFDLGEDSPENFIEFHVPHTMDAVDLLLEVCGYSRDKD